MDLNIAQLRIIPPNNMREVPARQFLNITEVREAVNIPVKRLIGATTEGITAQESAITAVAIDILARVYPLDQNELALQDHYQRDLWDRNNIPASPLLLPMGSVAGWALNIHQLAQLHAYDLMTRAALENHFPLTYSGIMHRSMYFDLVQAVGLVRYVQTNLDTANENSDQRLAWAIVMDLTERLREKHQVNRYSAKSRALIASSIIASPDDGELWLLAIEEMVKTTPAIVIP
jgi:hypothetical protein